MRAKALGFVILLACVLIVGRTSATPSGPTAELTPRPAQYLAAVMNGRSPGQAPPPSPTASPPSPTRTPPISTTVGISGSVYLNPRWAITSASAQPIQYLVLMDVTGSMSWDFNGYGTYDGTNTTGGGFYTVPNSVRGDVQCDAPENPNPLSLPYTDRCIGGMNSAWRTSTERRIYVAKQALASMIDRIGASDSMRIISFSTSISSTATATSGWIGDKAALKASVLSLGMYNGDPYRTAGGASNAAAMQKARELLAAAPPTAPNGQPYKQVMIMITDSVAHIFLNGSQNTARDICAHLPPIEALRTADPCQVGATADGRLRPVSAMLGAAFDIKADHPNLLIYVVGLAHVSPVGLTQVASAPNFFYAATQAAQLDPILSDIQAQLGGASCTPAGGNHWVNQIDAAHLPSRPDLSDAVVGRAYIYQAGTSTPLFVLPVQRNLATNQIGFQLPPPDASNPGIQPGVYELMAYVAYKGDDQITRQYDWVSNTSGAGGASRVSFAISSSIAGGQVVPLDPLFLDLRPSVSVCP